MNPFRRSRRLGITLVELMVAITITGIVGAALIQVMMAQNRAAGNNEAWRVARSVSRGSLNRLLADLRMAEANGALDAATVDGRDITLRVPYAFGVACNSTLPMAVSILPVDNALWSAAVFAGWAWRDDGTAAYRYRSSSGSSATIFSPGTASVCAIPGDTIKTLPLGRVVNLNASSFGTPGTPGRGMNVFVYQRVRYWFGASSSLLGQIALHRSVLGSGTQEELAAPFDATARFQFYRVGSSNAQSSVPSPRSDTRGIEIHLDGLSETVPQGSTAQKRIALTTSVFFKNHHD